MTATRTRSRSGGDGPLPYWMAGPSPGPCRSCGEEPVLRLIYMNRDFIQAWLCPTFERLLDELMDALFGKD